MKHKQISLAIAILLLASLACNAITGGGSTPSDLPSVDSSSPTEAPASDSSNDASGDSASPTEAPAGDASSDVGAGNTSDLGFPMTDDAYDITDIGDVLLYYSKLPQQDVLEFYRAEYTARGYTERELLTVNSDGVFSIVFDGDPSGKAVVIQSVDLGDGSCTVSITLEDV